MDQSIRITPREHPRVANVRGTDKVYLTQNDVVKLLCIDVSTARRWRSPETPRLMPMQPQLPGTKMIYHIDDVRQLVGLPPIYGDTNHDTDHREPVA